MWLTYASSTIVARVASTSLLSNSPVRWSAHNCSSCFGVSISGSSFWLLACGLTLRVSAGVRKLPESQETSAFAGRTTQSFGGQRGSRYIWNMDTWVHQEVRAVSRRRVAAWGVILAGAMLFAVVQSRYISNFAKGPFELGRPELDAITDVSTTPRYSVSVTGSKAIDTGIQQISTRKHGGVETSRSVSAAYYALVIGDRLLIVKRAAGMPTTVQGELAPMPVQVDSHLFSTPQMQAIRGRFYPYYLDDSSFRTPGYIGIGVALILVVLLVKFGLPAWRYARDASSHPIVKRAILSAPPSKPAGRSPRRRCRPRTPSRPTRRRAAHRPPRRALWRGRHAARRRRRSRRKSKRAFCLFPGPPHSSS